MPGEISFYDLLGLKPDATQDEIRSAYDALMARMKPNVERDTANTIRLAAAVKQAWETLGDPDKRFAYDETLRGTASYADVWRRSQQASYLDERNEWFDLQVRRAQLDRQTAHELQAEREQFDEVSVTAAAAARTANLAREAALRAAAAKNAVSRAAQARLLRSLAFVAVLVAVIAASVWGRMLIGRRSAAPASIPTVSAAPVAKVGVSAQPRAPNRRQPKNSSSSNRVTAAPERLSGAMSAPAAGVTAERTAPVRATTTSAQSQTQAVASTVAQSHRGASARPAYVCKTVAIATVTHDGATVDLSDGSRFQLIDLVDRAQAGGWITGTAVAKCAWPAKLKRVASLNVNGYTVRAQPAIIVATVVSTPSSAPSAAPTTTACADASITEVSDDGYGMGLSDGHVYAVDSAGHVTASTWLVGDAVSVCSTPARGAKAYTVARSGTPVNALRTQSLATAARAPTLCVVRLVSALADDGSRVTFNDGHSYLIDSLPGRTIVAGWSRGERITVCIRLASGTVYATLAHGSLTAHAVRAD